MSKRTNSQPANGSDLRGPQLVVTDPPAVQPELDAACIGVGEKLTPPETTIAQLRALDSVLVQVKLAVANATLNIAEMTEQREQLMVQARGSADRYMQAMRAAASGLGIDLNDKTQAWNYEPSTSAFTRIK